MMCFCNECWVVVIGMVGISFIGIDWNSVLVYLQILCNVVQCMFGWDEYIGLYICLGVLVVEFLLFECYNCKIICSMGWVVLMVMCVSEWVLVDVGLLEDLLFKSGQLGIVYGFLVGMFNVIVDFVMMFVEKNICDINVNIYFKMMVYMVLVNMGVFFGIIGCIIIIFSVCILGSQGIGYVYEIICSVCQVVMVVGGFEELCVIEVVVFDIFYVISVCNDMLQLIFSFFDCDCDGLVLGEGVGSLILEDLEYVQVCGVCIYVEIVGFGINSDGVYVINFNVVIMQVVIQMVLDDVGLLFLVIGYINVYGIGICQGDMVEIQVIVCVFGNGMLISLFKSYMGYIFGVCGVLEVWLFIEMMCYGWFVFIINLQQFDFECGELDYFIGDGWVLQCEYVMLNNFVFGGINILLIFKNIQQYFILLLIKERLCRLSYF